MNLILIIALVLLAVLIVVLLKRGYPLYVAVLILADLFVIAWQLHLPEGWPRAVAVVVVLAAGGLMVWLAKKKESRALNNKAGR